MDSHPQQEISLKKILGCISIVEFVVICIAVCYTCKLFLKVLSEGSNFDNVIF